MDYFQTKTLLALLAVAAALTAALSMLTLMGKAEKRASAKALRNTHRAAGYAFALILAALAVMGARYLAVAGDALPLRGVLHWMLASALIVLFLLKIAIVRWYRQFLKYVAVMGMILVVLVLIVAAVSAGFYVLSGGSRASGADTTKATVAGAGEDGTAPTEAAGTAPAGDAPGDAESGEALFLSYCAGCHAVDPDEKSAGPGLAGLFRRDRLSSSGRPVTRENVSSQILSPAGGMPSFEGHVSEDELADLVAYLETL
jgi:mono/diheme cytochrome c family protein